MILLLAGLVSRTGQRARQAKLFTEFERVNFAPDNFGETSAPRSARTIERLPVEADPVDATSRAHVLFMRCKKY